MPRLADQVGGTSNVIQRLRALWTSFVGWLFPGNYGETFIWSKYWVVTLFLSALCVFIRGRISIRREWISYLPSGALCVGVLIYLQLRFPFPTRISFWKMAVIPVIGVWLPYTIQTIGSPPLAFLSHIVEKLLDWKSFPRFAPPWAYGNGVVNTLVCVALTVAVGVTAFVGRSGREAQ